MNNIRQQWQQESESLPTSLERVQRLLTDMARECPTVTARAACNTLLYRSNACIMLPCDECPIASSNGTPRSSTDDTLLIDAFDPPTDSDLVFDPSFGWHRIKFASVEAWVTACIIALFFLLIVVIV